MTMDNDDVADAIKEYLALYADQPPRRAQLVVPGWALQELAALPEAERQEILDKLDWIAGGYGLATPVEIVEVTDDVP